MSFLDNLRKHVAWQKDYDAKRKETRIREDDEEMEHRYGRFFNDNDKKTEEGKITKDILELMLNKKCLTKEQYEQYVNLIPYPDQKLAFFFIKNVFKEIGNCNYKFIDATCQVMRDLPRSFSDLNDYQDENEGARFVCQVLGKVTDADIYYATYKDEHKYVICLDWKKALEKRKQAVQKAIDMENKKLIDYEAEHKEDLDLIAKIKKAKKTEAEYTSICCAHEHHNMEYKMMISRVEEALKELENK